MDSKSAVSSELKEILELGSNDVGLDKEPLFDSFEVSEELPPLPPHPSEIRESINK